MLCGDGVCVVVCGIGLERKTINEVDEKSKEKY